MNRLRRLFDQCVYWLMALGLVVTGVLMLGLFGAGFFVVGRALGVFAGVITPHPPVADPVSDAIVGVLHGLEYLFVAPLAFLLFRALIDYIAESRPDGNPGADLEIRRIKTLIVSLMISAVATDLVSKILGSSTLTLNVAAPGLLAIVVFSGYLLVLHRAHQS